LKQEEERNEKKEEKKPFAAPCFKESAPLCKLVAN